MLKFFYKKTIALILSNILISATAVSSAQAYMRPLSPYNFNEMYKMAARGDVTSLHKAISRGLNINAMDANGDTGVCVAVKRRDAKAYNTFRAVGASGSPHCRWNISHWDSFINSAPVRAGAKWRSADYTMPVYAGAAEKSNMWWWIGGAAALGGGAALALGGGGGGGGSDNKPKPAICDTTEYPISGNCPDNGVCGQCVDSAGAHYKLNSCNVGYTLSNDKKSCIQNQNPTTCDTTEYPISGSCPDNGVCGQCVDSAGAHYKLNSCNDGYTLSNDKKSCIQNQNPTICDTTEYPISGNCPDNGVCGQCVDSAGAHYKLNSCNVGYIMATDKKSCFKFEPDPCDTTVYTMTSCPENGICGDCTDSNGKYYKFNGCQSGYFVGADGQSCVETPEQVICNTAVYNLTGCPEGALCSPCTDTTGTYYKFTGCLGGYTQKPNEETCVKVTESSDSDVANDKILVIDENNKVSDGDTKIIGFSNADSPNSNLFNAKTKDALITIDAVNNTTFKNHDLVGLGPINAGSVQTVNAYDGKTGDIVIKTYYGTHSIYGIYGSGTLYNSLNGVGNIEINSQGEQLNSGTQISGMHSYDSDKYLYNAFGGTGKITIKVAAGYINGMKGVNLINAYNGGNGEINITSKARDVVRDGYIRGMAFSSNNGGFVANAYANDDSVTTGTITINNTDSREAKGISGGKSLIDWDLSYRNMLIYNAYGKNSTGKIIINGPGAGIAVGYTDNQVYNGANGGYGYIEISGDSGAYYSGYVGGIFLYNSSNYGYNGSSGGTGEIKISFPNTIYDQEDDKKIIYGIYGAIDNGSPDGGKGIIDINVADNEAIGVYGGGNYKDSSIKVVSKTNSGTVKGISNVRHVQSGNTTEIKESFASSYVNHNNGTVTVEAKGANATGYGIYSKGVDAVNDVLGKISVSSTDSGNAYGIYADNGNNNKVLSNGTIAVSSWIGDAYGIYANGGKIESGGSISVDTRTGKATGIYGNHINNSADIQITAIGTTPELIGIYTDDSVQNSGNIVIDNQRGFSNKVAGLVIRGGSNFNSGKIDLSDMQASEDGTEAERTAIDIKNATIENKGDIIVRKGGYGIKGDNADIIQSGKIEMTGGLFDKTAFYLTNGSSLKVLSGVEINEKSYFSNTRVTNMGAFRNHIDLFLGSAFSNEGTVATDINVTDSSTVTNSGTIRGEISDKSLLGATVNTKFVNEANGKFDGRLNYLSQIKNSGDLDVRFLYRINELNNDGKITIEGETGPAATDHVFWVLNKFNNSGTIILKDVKGTDDKGIILKSQSENQSRYYANSGTIDVSLLNSENPEYTLEAVRVIGQADFVNSGIITATANVSVKALWADTVINRKKVIAKTIGSYTGATAILANTYTGGTEDSDILAEGDTATGVSAAKIVNKGTITAKGNKYAYGISQGSSTSSNHPLENSGNINAMATSGNAYGINTIDGKVINNGTINVSSESGNAYGIWARGGSVENNGSITVNAPTGRAYGICALGGATVINRGEIILNNTPCEGACDGSVANGNYIKFDDYSTLSNASLISAAGALDFDAMGGRVMLAEGGRFAADELSGRLSVAADITAKGFKNEYTAADAIASADVSRLNLQSQSALFDAKLAENGRDVTLTMKSFNEVVKNKSLANFLQNNYAAQNNENLFSSLKSLENVEQINNGLNKFAGQDLFSRMAFEDFTMLRELNFDMNEQMFGGNKNEYFSISGNTAPFAFENNNGSNSRWSLTGKKSGDTTYALGFAFTDVYSNGADNQNRRADRMFNISAPVGYKLGGLKMVSTPRFGYAYGTYNRKGFNNRDYKGTLSKQMFGFMNEARLPFKAAGWTLAPSAELNMVNYRTEGAEADNLPYALRVKEQNNYSLEAGLGLHAGKQVNFDEQSALSLNLSAAVYHEFGNPYKTKVTVNGMSGNFAVKDENRGANRAVLRSNFEFTRGNTVLGGALMSYFDHSLNSKASLNLKYGF